MDKNNQHKFKEIMIGLGEYYGKEITEVLIKIYWYDLKPFTLDEFKKGCSIHRMNPDNGQFFPKTADIVKALKGTTKQQEQDIYDAAQLQWMVIKDQIKRVGSYGNLDLEDKQALAAIKSLGGWQFICSKTEKQLEFLNKDFVSAYKNFEKTPLEDLPNKLNGRIELENHKKSRKPSIEFKRLMDGIENHRQKNKEQS